MPKNVRDLGKLITAKGFNSCPKPNKLPNLVTLKERSKRICPKVIEVWNTHVRYNFWGVVINKTAYHLGRCSIRLLLLTSYMDRLFLL